MASAIVAPPGVVADELQDRPVRAPHHPRRTELVEHVGRVGGELHLGPPLARLGGQTRQLAQHVGVSREPSHVGGPGIHRAVRDAGLRAVIDHDRQLGVALAKAREAHEVARQHQRVEAQPRLGHRVERGAKLAPKHPVVVGDVLDHRAKPEKLRVPGQALDRRRRVRRGEIGPAHHAQDPVVALGEIEQELGLGDGRRGLDEHARVDAGTRHERAQVTGFEVAVDRLEFGREPAVVVSSKSPEVLVRIDSHEAGTSLGRSAGRRGYDMRMRPRKAGHARALGDPVVVDCRKGRIPCPKGSRPSSLT